MLVVVDSVDVATDRPPLLLLPVLCCCCITPVLMLVVFALLVQATRRERGHGHEPSGHSNDYESRGDQQHSLQCQGTSIEHISFALFAHHFRMSGTVTKHSDLRVGMTVNFTLRPP